mgnify:CR=1 FL=1
MSFGSRLKSARKTRNMTQSQLAEALHVNSSYVSKLELETSIPSDMLISMASIVLHVEEAWLRTGEGSMESRTDRIREFVIEEPDLRQRLTQMEYREQQLEQLRYLFAPTYPRIWDMLKLLSDGSASDFVARLNLLIKEWDLSDIKSRARIEVRMEDMIIDFPDKISAYHRFMSKRTDKGSVVPFDEIAVSEAPSAPARVMLPVLGRAAAGAPKSMISLEGEELRTNGDVAHDIRPGDFIVIADGDSMVDCGIHDGDHCVIHQTPEVSNGQIALVAVDDGSTIKRFYKERDGFRLVPCSADHAEQHYPPDAPIRVLGKFVKVIQPDQES